MEKTILVVGAGLSGVCIARCLADRGLAVTVIDKKEHVAGHCFDFTDEHGIKIHKYGPHIFHTSNDNVFIWLSRFTDWLNYEHAVVAELESGDLVPFPPNTETLLKVEKEYLVDTFYRPYTEKMWGLPIDQVNPKILNRVPIRADLENRYFPKDKFQKLPSKGYTELVKSILNHDLISLKLSTPYEKSMSVNVAHTFNSMPIDEFFNFKYGHLPYRSVRFHHTVHDQKNITKHPVVNFTDASPFTRKTEWKNFPGHGTNCTKTVITKEQPCDYRDNNFERYYPVNDASGDNYELYKRYKRHTPKDVTFIGRCGLYAYINMDQAVSSALAVAKRFLKRGSNDEIRNFL